MAPVHLLSAEMNKMNFVHDNADVNAGYTDEELKSLIEKYQRTFLSRRREGFYEQVDYKFKSRPGKRFFTPNGNT